MSKEYFYFTIGPVQSFVSQARRTRDFWAGSFLLSWMAGVAMVAVKKQNGKIIFPEPGEDYLAWVTGAKYEKNGEPHQGTIPNRFMAMVPADFNPETVIDIVQNAWRALSEDVWKADVGRVADWGNDTRKIWDRQIGSFWEISWVLSDKDENNLLDRRKNWRNHFPAPEPGTKCMVMDGWQEISGWQHSRKDEHRKQKDFWEAVRQDGSLDFQENEKLCAMAFVKRRFAHHFANFSYSQEGVNLKGWKLPTNVPSVAYLAAVHWIEQIVHHSDEEKKQKALRLLKDISPGRDEWSTRIACLDAALEENPTVRRGDISLDGEVFFESSWQNEEEYPDRTAVAELKSTLRALDISAPSPFYAILSMDGDSLGEQVSNPDDRPKIAEALREFTKEVPHTVRQNNGVLIYAGGDDVLAILPLEDALQCAKKLRDTYEAEFQKHPGIHSTLSGAIEFAHFKTPLGAVLQDAHSLLDDVAKDGCGRDALAVRAWKPGGVAFTWAQPWGVALNNGEMVIEDLARDLRNNQVEGTESTFSSKFLYKIREQFELLNPGKGEKALFDEDQMTSLIAAEYLSSGVVDGSKITLSEAKTMIRPLLRQCCPHVRDAKTNQPIPTDVLTMDGALLVRFLAYKGKDVR